MSRIGNNAITIPADVTLSQNGNMIVVKGKNGELSAPLHTEVEMVVADNIVTLKPRRKTKLALSLWGTMRASISNMVVGVSTGFERKLEINGVGYRAAMQGNKLVLSLGFNEGFLSRGEQKKLSIVFWMLQVLVLAKDNSDPVVLIDDISSELDQEKINSILDFLTNLNIQIFITDIGNKDLPLDPKKTNIYLIKNGVITSV